VERAGVLIVGGGPAGSTCARWLAGAGRDVLVLDAATFPRDKPCAGWITPEAVAELPFALDAYGATHTVQPITGFRVGRIGGRARVVDYGETVSFGIRRGEFDAELLGRAGARVHTGVRVTSVERRDGLWMLNGRYAAPMIVGAGGDACPVATHLGGPPEPAALVVTKEIEYPLDEAALERSAVEPGRPELYFSRDLRGYGWCFRKGGVLNVGLGRRDPRGLSRHVEAFVDWLVAKGRIARPPAQGWRGYAYRVRLGARRLVDDGVVLVGDAAGLAAPESGEGILPALVSGRLAAEAILAAGGDCRAARLSSYEVCLAAGLGPARPPGPPPGPLAVRAGALLFASTALMRQVVLDRWFLHRKR
jgi:geranylgeranyl reductase family protein